MISFRRKPASKGCLYVFIVYEKERYSQRRISGNPSQSRCAELEDRISEAPQCKSQVLRTPMGFSFRRMPYEDGLSPKRAHAYRTYLSNDHSPNVASLLQSDGLPCRSLHELHSRSPILSSSSWSVHTRLKFEEKAFYLSRSYGFWGASKRRSIVLYDFHITSLRRYASA